MTDILRFYNNSKNAPAGSGVGDVVQQKEDYTELNRIPHWRRMFSSRYEEQFNCWGVPFLSHDHALQYAKYKCNDIECNQLNEIAYLFSLASGSEMSQSVKLIKKKIILLNEEQLNRYESQLSNIKNDIYRAKYTRQSNPGKALLLTQNALLVNKGPRIRTIICERLMKQREYLRLEDLNCDKTNLRQL
jgi:hypothetical protein